MQALLTHWLNDLALHNFLLHELVNKGKKVAFLVRASARVSYPLISIEALKILLLEC